MEMTKKVTAKEISDLKMTILPGNGVGEPFNEFGAQIMHPAT